MSTPEKTVAVVGAGPSGLATLKNLLDAQIPAVVYEAHDGIGGIWNRSNPKSSVYRETHTITSRDVTAFSDFPMDQSLPVFPRHDQVLAYLEAYAARFDLLAHVRTGRSVESVTRANRGWRVATSDGETVVHSALVIANGHNWSPRIPRLPGDFSGKVLHSCDYDSPTDFDGQRMLVIGAGNSGCDIASQCAPVASHVTLSVRRGYPVYPKFLLGVPSDKMGGLIRALRLPPRLTTAILRGLIRASIGDQTAAGLPKPDHNPLESPPIINSLVPYFAAHGRIDIRPGVGAVDGHRVTFTDGSTAEFDSIVTATGFRLEIPFIDPRVLDWDSRRPDFYLFAFSPTHDDLFIAGMTDGTGGHFPTVELQSKVIAAYIAARTRDPRSPGLQRFDELRRRNQIDLTGGIRFLDIDRNATQFSLAVLVEALHEHLALLRDDDAAPPMPRSRRDVVAAIRRELLS